MKRKQLNWKKKTKSCKTFRKLLKLKLNHSVFTNSVSNKCSKFNRVENIKTFTKVCLFYDNKKASTILNIKKLYLFSVEKQNAIMFGSRFILNQVNQIAYVTGYISSVLYFCFSLSPSLFFHTYFHVVRTTNLKPMKVDDDA